MAVRPTFTGNPKEPKNNARNQTPMAQAFSSYSRRELAFVEDLASDLKAAGLDVWYDLSGLGGGACLPVV